jgi:phage terminase small subunit
MRPKHKTFADEWLVDQDGQKAAVRAGYSPKYARMTAYKILQRPEVKAYIKKKLDDLVMGKDEALQLLGVTAREANSETVRLRALEKVIDVHGLADKPLEGDITLRVVREDVGSKDIEKDTPPEAEDNSSTPLEA